MATEISNQIGATPITSFNLSIEDVVKFKQYNKEMLPTVLEFYNAHKHKIIRNNVQWRKFEQKQEQNWLIHKKFNQTDDEKLYSQFRSILNKLTDANFNELAKELVEQQITKHEHLETLVNLIFRKAITEHKFSVIYAKLSHELAQYFIRENDKDVYFKELLINKCQSTFNECISADQQVEAAESPKSKQLIIGCMTFIGELYNYELLINKIINSCFLLLIMKMTSKKPTDNNQDDKEQITSNRQYIIESICTLMRVVGSNFSKNAPNETKNIFDKLKKFTAGDILTKKDKFAIQDMIDLKIKEKW